VDFGRPIGSEPAAHRRPAVVVSEDAFNQIGAGLVIVVPTTTRERGIPYHVKIGPGASGLRATSWAKAEGVRSVSKLRLVEYLGHVEEGALEQVELALLRLLGLSHLLRT
jgi:mRNA interferase MazF